MSELKTHLREHVSFQLDLRGIGADVHVGGAGIKVHWDVLPSNGDGRDEFHVALNRFRSDFSRLIVVACIQSTGHGTLGDLVRLEIIQINTAEAGGGDAELAVRLVQSAGTVGDIVAALDSLNPERPASPGLKGGWCSQGVIAQGKKNYKRKDQMHVV
jgi:hypothetical protein